MDLKSFFNTLSEIIYILCGLVSISTAFRGLKNEKAKIGTFLFWFILGVIFILGNTVPYEISGVLGSLKEGREGIHRLGCDIERDLAGDAFNDEHNLTLCHERF